MYFFLIYYIFLSYFNQKKTFITESTSIDFT